LRSLLASKLPPSFRPGLATEAGSVSIPFRLPARRLASAAVLASFVLAIVLARRPVAESFDRLRALDPLPLVLGATAIVVALAASAGAWRCALRSGGARIGRRAAWGCYGVGSLANAVLPARLGDAVRVGLYASFLDRPTRHRLSGGACLAVATARAVVYVLLCAGAASVGLLPGWLLAAPPVLAAVLLVAFARLRRRASGRPAGLGLLAELSPGTGAALLGWAGLAASARIAAAVGILSGLDVAHPLRAAFVGLTALAAAGTLPLAPGGAGVAGAGMALALVRSGVSPSTAVAAAIAFHAVETVASLVFGVSGWIALRTTGARPSTS